MNFEDLALIPAQQSFRQRLAEGLTLVEREFGCPGSLDSWQVYAFDSLSSTMDLAPFIVADQATPPQATVPVGGASGKLSRALAEARVREADTASKLPAAIVSLEQHSGRGRDGRAWMSTPQGGLYVTFLLCPRVLPQRVLGYSLGIGLAIQEFLDRFGIVSGLKWPNDVLVSDARTGQFRKIAGILIEMSGTSEKISSLSVGIGLNLTQSKFPDDVPGISMTQILGTQVDLVSSFALLMHTVTGMLERLERHGFPALAEQYNRRSLANGAMVRIYHRNSPVIARVIEVASDGGLRVDLGAAGGEQVVYSGELELEGYPRGR